MNRLLSLVLVAGLLTLSGCPSSRSPGLWQSDGASDVSDLIPGDAVPPGDAVIPAGCQSDADCPGGHCNPNTFTCVECLTSQDCPEGEVCSKWECIPLVQCEKAEDCAEGLVCDLEQGVCVECVEDEDCPGGICEDNVCKLPCSDGCPEGMLCDDLTGFCVDCLSDKDCEEAFWCYLAENACYEDLCGPDEAICLGNTPAACAENGSGWVPKDPCPDGQTCMYGACVDGPVCQPGTKLCKDDFTVIVCGDDGFTLTELPCPGDTHCFNGECIGGCVGECEGKECGPDGCGGVCGECPEGTYCSPEFLCMEGICMKGTVSCQGNAIIECLGPEVGWGEPKPCPDDMFCVDGQCADQPWVCVPGAVECMDGAIAICNEDGSGWGIVEPCPPGTICQQGACVPFGPGSCGEAFQCMAQVQCDAPEPVCMDYCLMTPDGTVPDLAYELYFCVFQACGMWDPFGPCFKEALTFKCGDLYAQCVGGCVPNCEGKQCGGDGCGGVCGQCGPGQVCGPKGMCSTPCEPKCGGKQCGPDGCGGNCGVCEPGYSCTATGACQQVCKPNCTGKVCGTDGCGGSCGTCKAGFECNLGQCVKAMSCAELVECTQNCGEWDPGCQNDCLANASPAAKDQWVALVNCLAVECGNNGSPSCYGKALTGACSKQWNACQNCTPTCMGKQCGPDGCGFNCGQCPTGFQCDPFGTCLCTPLCQDKECGTDGCGGSCGTCPTGSVCSATGHCACMPKCAGKVCGPDGCNGSCGSCPAGQNCNPTLGQCQPGPGACGNGACEAYKGETCQSCPQDCPCGGDCCEAHDYPGCSEPMVMECTCQYEPFCCFGMWDEFCADIAVANCKAQCGGCTPMCLNKECGTDGCNGSCGTCPAGSTCNAAGICEQTCKPSCLNKQCGSDGCGGSCGLCPSGSQCKNFACVAALSCKELVQCYWTCSNNDQACQDECNKQASPAAKAQWWALIGCVMEVCGENAPDGCFGQAIQGECKDLWYACQNCTPACVGKLCGPDGCGGTCGECPGGYTCDNYGTCLCAPQCVGKTCGPDGCSGSCGTCLKTQVCNYKGQCVCVPQCTGKQCGDDGCGGSCGTCPQGMMCGPAGVCVEEPNDCGNGMCEPYLGEDCFSCPQDCPCQEGDCCQPHDFPGCDQPEVVMCVCETDPFCCQSAWDGLCVNEAQQCGAWCPCTPNCDGKMCGDDGCGGSCGQCPPGSNCNQWGQCTGTKMCGNGKCQPGQGETCETCPVDCGQCVCGDGQCNSNENCGNCPWDCGECTEGDCCQAHDAPGCNDPDIVACVCQMDSYCCQAMWDEICVNEAKEQCGAQCGGCIPQCFNADGTMKQCGDDGCGGSCGTCPPNSKCDFTIGLCVGGCVPNCVTGGVKKQCGPDGCGGSCGTCPPGQACNLATGMCFGGCIPNCAGKQCGSDGCGGSCGTCPAGQQCSATGQCSGTSATKCPQMVDCAIQCNFSPSCTYGCYGNGTDSSKALFQDLTWCVLQACGWQITPTCVKESLYGACADQYKMCLSDL